MAKQKSVEETAQTPPTKIVTASDPNIEVSQEWRRKATRAQLERLWNAAELGRNGLLNEVGDDSLDAQRSAFAAFSRTLLGPDAPVMEVLG
jgi:hypothetical protein